MKNVLVLLAHPNIDESHANKLIINELKQIKTVAVRDLSKLYPDFKINVEAEHDALLKANIIVFQFPLFWYSVPPILKQWMDSVLTHGFAFGENGDRLKDKELWVSVTAGGPEDSYSSNGYNNYKLEQLLYPLYQTANHTHMKLTQVVKSFKMEYIPNIQNNLEDVELKAKEHASILLNLIKEL